MEIPEGYQKTEIFVGTVDEFLAGLQSFADERDLVLNVNKDRTLATLDGAALSSPMLFPL
jgi:hypothetical protein